MLKHKISWKSFQWEPSCSFWTERYDIAKSHLSQFKNAPEKYSHLQFYE